MTGIAEIDQHDGPAGLRLETVRDAVELVFRRPSCPFSRLSIAQSLGEPFQGIERMRQRGFAADKERQAEDGCDRRKSCFVPSVEWGGEDQVGCCEPQLLEIGSATQAKIERLLRQRNCRTFDAEADQFAGSDRLMTQRTGGFQHGPVDGCQTQVCGP